jgi:hypothetical protein
MMGAVLDDLSSLMNFMTPGVTSDGPTLLHWHLPPDVLDSTIQLAIAFGESLKRINKVMVTACRSKFDADHALALARTSGPADVDRVARRPLGT